MCEENQLDKMTLGMLKSFNPQAYNSIKIHLVDSYDNFLKTIYSTLDQIIKNIQENPQHHEGHSEDQITNHIISNLKIIGFNAYSDPDTGGHIDIRIDKPGTDYLWLGEAKKDNSLDKVHEGFLQLTTRYATCGLNQTEGCILIYIIEHPAAEFIKQCKEYLHNKDIDGLEVLDPPDNNPLSFFSKSNIPRMGKGIKYKVKHIGISLYFLPEDSSGRTAKKYIKKRKKIQKLEC